MPFEKGHKKVKGSGIKKGQKQHRVTFRDLLEKEWGDTLPDALARRLKDAEAKGKETEEWRDYDELVRTALPYCHKKMAIDHSIVDEEGISIDYRAVLISAGLKPRKPKQEKTDG